MRPFPRTATDSSASRAVRLIPSLHLLCAVALAALGPLLGHARPAASAGDMDVVAPGNDPLTTYGQLDLGKVPIPHGHFGPGSLAPSAVVSVMGDPFDPAIWSAADSLILRSEAASIPQDATVSVPVQLVELNLKSQAPVVVLFEDGRQEAYQVTLTVSQAGSSEGTLDLHRTDVGGGFMAVEVSMIPRLVFRRIPDSIEVVFDFGTRSGIPPVRLVGSAGWAFNCQNMLQVPDLTSNFCPGGDQYTGAAGLFSLFDAVGGVIGLVTTRTPVTGPVLAPIDERAMREGERLTIPLSVSSPNPLPHIFEFSDPSGICDLTTLTDGTAALVCAPQLGQAGIYTVEVWATDGIHEPVKETIQLTVLPKVSAGGPYETSEGGAATTTATCSDSATCTTFDWDLDGDGLYDDASGPHAVFDSGLRPPGTYNIGVKGCTGPVPVPLCDADRTTVTVVEAEGTLTIFKRALPADDGQVFSFIGDLGAFLLDANNLDSLYQESISFRVSPGSFDVGELVPAGWDLASGRCDDTDSTLDLVTATAHIVVAAGEHVTCTFDNVKLGAVTVTKVTSDPTTTSFGFAGDLGEFDLDTDENDLTLPAGEVFEKLVPGPYVVTEDAVPGWDLESIECTDPNGDSVTDVSARTATIRVGPGEAVHCFFYNKREPAACDEAPCPDEGGTDVELFSKSPRKAAPVDDEPVVYDIIVRNNGSETAHGVSILDEFSHLVEPQSMTLQYRDSDGAPTRGDGTCPVPDGPAQVLLCSVGDLAPGEVVVLVVEATTERAGELHNTAVLSAANDSTPDNNARSAVVTMSTDVEMVGKEGPQAMIQARQTFFWTITMRNNGTRDALDVVIDDPLPPGLRLESATTFSSDVPSLDGQPCSLPCMVGTLPPGATVVLDLTVVAEQQGDYVNVATVSASNDATPGNNEDRDAVTVIDPLVGTDVELVSKKAFEAGPVGFFYLIHVRNNGPAHAVNLVIHDQLPASIRPHQVSVRLPPDGDEKRCTLPCRVGVLKAGEEATLVILAEVLIPGKTTNTSRVSALNDSTPDNNEGSVTVEVVAAPADLEMVAKRAPEGPVGVHQVFHYVIDIRNNGPNPVTDVFIVDAVPDGLRVTSSVLRVSRAPDGRGQRLPRSSSCPLPCRVGWMNVGDTAELLVAVQAESAGTYVNTARVLYVNDPIPENNFKSATVTVSERGNGSGDGSRAR